MMPHLYQCGWIGFSGKNIEASIDLKCVGVDNFGADFFRDISRQLRLSAGGGTGNEKLVFHQAGTFFSEIVFDLRQEFPLLLERGEDKGEESKWASSLPV